MAPGENGSPRPVEILRKRTAVDGLMCELLYPAGQRTGRAPSPTEATARGLHLSKTGGISFGLRYTPVGLKELVLSPGSEKHSPPAVRGPVGALQHQHVDQLLRDWRWLAGCLRSALEKQRQVVTR